MFVACAFFVERKLPMRSYIANNNSCFNAFDSGRKLGKQDCEAFTVLKLKLHNLFIMTASKLPKFEFWRTFSLVFCLLTIAMTSEKVSQNSNFGSLDAVMMNKKRSFSFSMYG